MAIKAIGSLKADWYTPACEEEEDEPTRFKLKPLDGTEYMDVMAEISTNTDGDVQVTGRGLRIAIKKGLVDWEKFPDPDTGKDLKYSPHNTKRVPPTILQELAGEIINRSELGEDLIKN